MMRLKVIPSLGFLLLLSLCDLVSSLGCGSNVPSLYTNLCDLDAVWGIVLEAVAAAGIVVTIALMVLFLFLIPHVSNPRKRSTLPIQFIFLIGTLGIFSLTFAFIIKLDHRTCPTRIFLWGVLFALCFSCLLAHAFRVLRLVRGKSGLSVWCLLGLVVGLTLVQVIIAIIWLVLTIERNSQPCQYSPDVFVMLLIYVMFLMALTFILSICGFCGRYSKWKKHGAYIFVTLLLSICIWVVWIVMFVRGIDLLNKRPVWDDPTLSIALVANGWVFIFFYVCPELRHLTCPAKPDEGPEEQGPKGKQPKGVDNQMFIMEQSNQANGTNPSFQIPNAMYSNTIPGTPGDFTIPRPQTRPIY
uniref:G protein-coupled receptor class C group 5 member D n=1 Tax=Callorhinchus milii TaxID=7868 RepID=A0A4W3IIZ4_CALMI|eukprot:gi/632982175/ref/XP_007907992.1/ PREDICTED: retinoic acid-induced protein 3-like [Callorhinchus milii]